MQQFPRIKFVAFFIIFLFTCVVVQLFRVQVLNSKEYKEIAKNQYVTGRSELESRGNIYFSKRDGTLISGATMNFKYILVVSPKKIQPEKEKIYNDINNIYPIDKDMFYEKVSNHNSEYKKIIEDLDYETYNKFRTKKIPGVTLERELIRFYPANKVASHVLGVVAYVGKYKEGIYGLEKYYEKYLSPGEAIIKINPFAQIFQYFSFKENLEQSKKLEIVTTIEPEIQIFLEKVVQDVYTDYSSDGVGGIVINPKTGAIIAMTYVPNFDPNNISKTKDASVFINPAVSRVYEFGSVIKPIIVASALETKVINKDFRYIDKGSIVVADRTIKNFDGKARGEVNLSQLLGFSLNTGMVIISEKLGPQNIRNYFEKFGLRSITEIDLPSETNSLTSNLNSNRPIEFAAASFGQGFAITPIQAVRAFSIIANKGIPVKPYIVKEIKTSGGKVVETFEPKNYDRVISEETAQDVTKILTTNTDVFLLNGKYSFPHHSVAIKTGTAQMVGSDGKYKEEEHLHSMFAYLPANDPEYLVFIYSLNPKNVSYASQSLAEPMFNYLRFLISYGTIKPDR